MVELTSLSDDPYGKIIEHKIAQTFPSNIPQPQNSVFESVFSEIIGTSRVRFGPKPNIESSYYIYQVIVDAIKAGKPIPILFPWGSKKTMNGESIDSAEIGSIRTINCLQSRVKRQYGIGLDVVIRVEDTSGYFLFADEGKDAINSSKKYVGDFTFIVNALKEHEIDVVLESSMPNASEFDRLASKISIPAYEHLLGIDVNNNQLAKAALDTLHKLGWKGNIPGEQHEYYMSRYARVYGSDREKQRRKFADYMGNSLAHYLLNMRGDKPEWNGKFIQINFANPVPGAPSEIISNRIHYRTIPSTQTEEHIPPWRARGFIEINNDNEAKYKLDSWFSNKIFNTIPITFKDYNTDNSLSVNIRYLVK